MRVSTLTRGPPDEGRRGWPAACVVSPPRVSGRATRTAHVTNLSRIVRRLDYHICSETSRAFGQSSCSLEPRPQHLDGIESSRLQARAAPRRLDGPNKVALQGLIPESFEFGRFGLSAPHDCGRRLCLRGKLVRRVFLVGNRPGRLPVLWGGARRVARMALGPFWQ